MAFYSLFAVTNCNKWKLSTLSDWDLLSMVHALVFLFSVWLHYFISEKEELAWKKLYSFIGIVAIILTFVGDCDIWTVKSAETVRELIYLQGGL